MSTGNPPPRAFPAIVGHVRNKGVTLWAQDGELHYRAPKGALTLREVQELRAATQQIVSLLTRSAAAGTVEGVSAEPQLAPLAFSQLAHWNVYRLHERPAIRQIASATRLRGRLQMLELSASFSAVVRRHDALRTRIELVGGTAMQRISPHPTHSLALEDLRNLPLASREQSIQQRIHRLILEPIDPCVGPLFAVHLLRVDDEEHVLVAVMEHMISDAYSMNVFLNELFDAYCQLVRHLPLRLPRVTVQFSQYAAEQQTSHDAWLARHGDCWAKHLGECVRLRFPKDETVAPSGTGWGEVPVRIDRKRRTELYAWCRTRRTTPVIAMFSVYAAAVLRWCKASDAVLVYQTDGRFSSDLQNTIGYVASPLYLRVRIDEQDTFCDVLQRATVELCSAYERADASYLEAMPAPEYTRNSRFNWVPPGHAMPFAELVGSEHALVATPVPFAHPMRRTLQRDTEPSIQLFDAGDEVVGEMLFPLSRYSKAYITRFCRDFMAFLDAVLRFPEQRLSEIELFVR